MCPTPVLRHWNQSPEHDMDWLTKNVNKGQRTLSQALEYLSSLKNNESSYKALNNVWALVSMNEIPFRQQKFFGKLMTGTPNQQPTTPKYTSIWDSVSLINFLDFLDKNKQLFLN